MGKQEVVNNFLKLTCKLSVMKNSLRCPYFFHFLQITRTFLTVKTLKQEQLFSSNQGRRVRKGMQQMRQCDVLCRSVCVLPQ